MPNFDPCFLGSFRLCLDTKAAAPWSSGPFAKLGWFGLRSPPGTAHQLTNKKSTFDYDTHSLANCTLMCSLLDYPPGLYLGLAAGGHLYINIGSNRHPPHPTLTWTKHWPFTCHYKFTLICFETKRHELHSKLACFLGSFRLCLDTKAAAPWSSGPFAKLGWFGLRSPPGTAHQLTNKKSTFDYDTHSLANCTLMCSLLDYPFQFQANMSEPDLHQHQLEAWAVFLQKLFGLRPGYLQSGETVAQQIINDQTRRSIRRIG